MLHTAHYSQEKKQLLTFKDNIKDTLNFLYESAVL